MAGREWERESEIGIKSLSCFSKIQNGGVSFIRAEFRVNLQIFGALKHPKVGGIKTDSQQEIEVQTHRLV